MPKDTELTKNQIWGVHLLQAFFDALRKDQLPDFLKSDDLERFLHEGEGGSFGGKVPDGTPGSKFPSAGGEDALGVLHGLFHGIGSGMGRVDHPGQADPAGGWLENVVFGADVVFSDEDVTDLNVHESRTANGDHEDSTTITLVRRDLSQWRFYERYDANGESTYWECSITGANGGYGLDTVRPDSHGGIEYTESLRSGDYSYTSTRHFDSQGRRQSPGEDGGGEANTGRNPLGNLEAVGPQSMQDMLNAMQHPGKDSESLDPNKGASGLKLTEADQERLGRTVPGAEVLDPNSGVDPLSVLDLDPSQMHTRSEKDDRVDPNTGLKPVPGGGSS